MPTEPINNAVVEGKTIIYAIARNRTEMAMEALTQDGDSATMHAPFQQLSCIYEDKGAVSMATDAHSHILPITGLKTDKSPARKTRILISRQALRDALDSGMGILIECDCPAASVDVTHCVDAASGAGVSTVGIVGLTGRIG